MKCIYVLNLIFLETCSKIRTFVFFPLSSIFSVICLLHVKKPLHRIMFAHHFSRLSVKVLMRIGCEIQRETGR